MLKCDLHIHSSFSRDGESRVEEILRQAEKVGLDAVAITDHDTVEGARYALTCETSLVIVPGIEVSTRQGHLLVLGVSEPIPSKLDFLETLQIAHRMGGLAVLPHPYHLWRHGIARKVKGSIGMVDAVEAFNSRYIVGAANRRAAIMARRYEKPCVGGSDAHHARFVGFGITFVEAEPSCRSILDAIRGGRTFAGCRMTPLQTYTRQSLRNVLKKMKRHVIR